jgi:hypothetical protein
VDGCRAPEGTSLHGGKALEFVGEYLVRRLADVGSAVLRDLVVESVLRVRAQHGTEVLADP